MFKPRPNQQRIINFEHGRMGISAVPGSGKTHTLSYLAANLIAKGLIGDDQEVLIVTLVNSAVDNFSQRISGFVQKEFGLLPNMGYRVRTLHGLASDIVKERPNLVGLENQFEIADERETSEIIQNIIQNWVRTHPEFITDLTKQDLEVFSSKKAKRNWDNLLVDITSNFIKQAKDLQLTPDEIAQLLVSKNKNTPLMEMGLHVYFEYQKALCYRGAVDFDDLIRLAYNALSLDRDFLIRLQKRWPYILEDEAQDSSALQEKILRLLADTGSHWVRVGDPNQAIYETFTTANPRFLREFLVESGVDSCSLPHSGRSTKSIINLANHLIKWTKKSHPVIEIRDALSEPLIQPTPPGDPQPNPLDEPSGIILYQERLEAAKEISIVAQSVKRWIIDHPEQTVAILVPRNDRGAEMVATLQTLDIDCVELLQTSQSTRTVARILSQVIRFLAEPTSPAHLAEMFKAYIEKRFSSERNNEEIKNASRQLKGLSRVENFLFPAPGEQGINILLPEITESYILDLLEDFRFLVDKWQTASLLPIDQFILTLSNDLFHEPADLAIAFKLAIILARAKFLHPAWELNDFFSELTGIATNRIKILGFSEEDTGFDPDKYKGKALVSTIHKAKGLEWDRVYLLSVNNYDFPSAQEYDQYISEKWFVRDQLNLSAELLAQLNSLVRQQNVYPSSQQGDPTLQSRLSYCSERLRLLFVGITRARKELVITWNTGRGQSYPAIPLQELFKYWENTHGSST